MSGNLFCMLRIKYRVGDTGSLIENCNEKLAFPAIRANLPFHLLVCNFKRLLGACF